MKRVCLAIAFILAQTACTDEKSDLITEYFKSRAYNPDSIKVQCDSDYTTDFSIVNCAVTGTNAYGGVIRERHQMVVEKGKVIPASDWIKRKVNEE